MAKAWRRLLASSPLCAIGGHLACSGPPVTLKDELDKLRPMEAEMRLRWAQDEAGWRKLPPRAWPPCQPKAHELAEIKARLEEERCPPAGTNMSEVCSKLTFNLATGRLFNNVEALDGLAAYRALAEAGDLDGMVGVGIALVESIGVDYSNSEGVHWLRRASELGSAQGLFELATLYYHGGAGLAEDEVVAYGLFEKSAALDHAAGLFMVADCLLEGIGCRQDAARAVPLLFRAAEKGHRGARQHLRQLLAGNYQGFENLSSSPRQLE